MNDPSAGPSTRPNATPSPASAARPARRRHTGLVIAVLLIVLLAAVWWVNHRQAAAGAGGRGPGAAGGPGGGRGGFGGPNAPLPVGVHPVGSGDIHVYLNALGTVTASHSAVIRTQISGQLQQIAFQEGQFVHQGDLLAVIDPRPYENALAQAQAQLKQAQAQLQTAQLDLDRYQKLAQEDSIARQQVDNARAQVNQFTGLAQVADAAIATANLNLTYCHIKAPFDGRIGLRQVDTGNYITPGDANGIAVLTETKPITVIFTLPEDNMASIATKLRSGGKLVVDALDRTQSKTLASGTVASMDNQIDPTTGTFKLRADFANEDETLFPNQFVNVRLLLDTLNQVTVVPTSAVERGQQGTYVYVVTPGHTAAVRIISLGPTEGEKVAVQSGLNPGEQIVTDGADRLRDGQKVIIAGENAPGAPTGRSGPGGPGGSGKGGSGRGRKGG